jgi:hypothetical protein
MEHSHHHEHMHHEHKQDAEKKENIFALSMQATLHCLLGCGIGEVAGMIISTAIGLSNFDSIVLSVTLGFIAGLALGIVPLKKFGFGMGKALKTVIVGEGLSIAVMEAFEVMTELAIPGVMNAHLNDSIFWIGMTAALAVGFVAALPVNYVFIKRGVRHVH